MKLRSIIDKGLAQTLTLWPDVRVAYRWVHQAAHILNNREGLIGPQVNRRLRGLLGAMSLHRARAGTLAPAVAHFLKVTQSYWPGLFHCYEVSGLPRTNNDLEHLFGSNRHHERRSTGRKLASPALVLRGSVRMIASTTTRTSPFSADEIAPRDHTEWRRLRGQMETRRQQRVKRQRFRRDPDSYLDNLEAKLLKLALPP